MASGSVGIFAPSATQTQPFIRERLGLFSIDFILSSTRKRNVALDAPGTFTFHILTTIFLSIFVNPAPLYILELKNICQLFSVDAVRIVDAAAGIRECNRFPPRSRTFSAANCATLPEPEIEHSCLQLIRFLFQASPARNKRFHSRLPQA